MLLLLCPIAGAAVSIKYIHGHVHHGPAFVKVIRHIEEPLRNLSSPRKHGWIEAAATAGGATANVPADNWVDIATATAIATAPSPGGSSLIQKSMISLVEKSRFRCQ